MSKLFSPTYRPDIDGLRGVCLSILVTAHAFTGIIPGAYLGVDVFFFISGYLMTSIITRSYESGNFSFATFYIRRLRRILPAFTVALGLVLVTGLLTFYPQELESLYADVFASSFMFANWKFLHDDTNYFAFHSKFRPLIHVWSLAIEEQFYLFIPVYFWALWRARVSFKAGLIVLLMASIGLYLASNDFDSTRYWSTHLRIWELSAGGLLVFFHFPGKHKNLSAVLGVICLVVGFIFLESWISITGKIVALAGAFLLIGAGKDAVVNKVILSHPALIWVGRASFSIYLWHWPVMTLSRILYAAELSAIQKLLTIVATVVAGGLSWKFIEQPSRKSPRWLPWVVGITLIGAGSHFALKFNFQGMKTNPAEDPVSPFRNCSKDFHQQKIGHINCRAPIEGTPQNLLIGDSHAADKYPGLSTLEPGRWKLVNRPACFPAIGYDDLGNPSCPKAMEAILNYAVLDPEIKTIVIAFNEGFKNHGRLKNRPGKELSQTELMIDGLRNALRFVSSSGKRIIFLQDLPVIPIHDHDCQRKRTSCIFSETDLLDLRFRNEIAHMIRREFPAVTLFDPNPIFCQDDVCRFIKDDVPYYRDRSHLSVRGSMIYAKEFLRQVKL